LEAVMDVYRIAIRVPNFQLKYIFIVIWLFFALHLSKRIYMRLKLQLT